VREIKFRAWNPDKKIMVYDANDINLGTNVVLAVNYGKVEAECMSVTESISSTKWIPAEIMQYTGLKDKNGKEIYEGDIVDSGLNVGQVSWDEEKLTFVVKWYESFTHPLRQHKTTIKVIGSVYENPELLKG
jgi:uncharacterized phage protein (TIGR01671 family)